MIKRIVYIKHLIFHPFDGFYDLKHEKRGSLGIAALIMLALIVVSVMKRQLSGFVFNINQLESLNVLSEIAMILIPYVLFCVANWAVTTLMDGEGSLKDIFIYVAYSFVPAVLFGLVSVVGTNILTLQELPFLNFVNALSTLWVVFLIFVGTLTTHQYTVSKTIGTFLIIVVCMGLMLFVFALFFTLIDRFISFINTIFMELSLRQ